MSSDWWNLMGALMAGLVAGGIFFGGLWWTTRRLLVSKHPGLLLLVSFLGRTSLVLALFFLVGRDHLDRLLVCLAGFILIRFVLLHKLPARVFPRKMLTNGGHAHETES